ncbi:hypothetical protein KM031_20275 (plasmid) [Gemmobacter fulvus]|uniref:Uncharacterized protein n=1 Tax=Gemmobacter fulvus TaxID=2840474 RepID=A0A975PBB9_9RHOB|nr:hypothetical protein [Gemmobacter fulvus]MBT9248049.1 hypothetical protein [Gemmobacter fulvus]QWK92925.1 hypothetical protein KM031_20275 [Gemmobacter fulvus]
MTVIVQQSQRTLDQGQTFCLIRLPQRCDEAADNTPYCDISSAKHRLKQRMARIEKTLCFLVPEGEGQLIQVVEPKIANACQRQILRQYVENWQGLMPHVSSCPANVRQITHVNQWRAVVKMLPSA